MKKYLMTAIILTITNISMCTTSQAKKSCINTLIEQFQPCLSLLKDDEINKKAYNMAKASMWLENKSKKYIDYCKKHDISISYYLLKAIGKLHPLIKDKSFKKYYDELDKFHTDFNFIAILAFQDAGIIYSEDSEEYVRCSWEPNSSSKDYSSYSTLYHIAKKCSKNNTHVNRKLFYNRSTLTDKNCTPHWLKIDQEIEKLLTEMKQPEIHFEDTANLDIKNSGYIEKMERFYNIWIPKEIEFRNDSRLEIENLVKTELFLEQKFAEFDHENNIDKITKVAKKDSSFFPKYISKYGPTSFINTPIILCILQEESKLLPNKELTPLLKNTINISELNNILFFYYGKKIWESEKRHERSCALQSYLPNLNNFWASQIWPGKDSSIGTWDKKINFKKINFSSDNENASQIAELYQNMFQTIQEDIKIPSNNQIANIVNTLLSVEIQATKLMEKPEEVIKDRIQKTYDKIKGNLPPKCICHNHPFGKMRVLLIFLELLGELDQKKALKNNLETVLRIENLFRLKFPQQARKHFELKIQYLDNTTKIINKIDDYFKPNHKKDEPKNDFRPNRKKDEPNDEL